jgi:hypothetical protein
MLRLVALSVAAATICPLALAQTCKKPSAPSAPVISKVTAPTFQLTQVSTKKIDDTTSTCLYKGNATLTLTTDDSTATAVPVNIELRTQTTLNKAGDGFTDGVISLYAPATHQLISGSLVAVNKEFGDLTGVIEGSMLSVGSARVELRVVFHGVFTQDASGAYTLVNVDANGVEAAYPRVGGGKK